MEEKGFSRNERFGFHKHTEMVPKKIPLLFSTLPVFVYITDAEIIINA